jgi:hypothetical protein
MKLAAPPRQQGTPAKQLASFIAEYSPEVAKVARGALSKLRKIFPGYFVIAYDNYNALAVGFASSERASDAVCSIALYRAGSRSSTCTARSSTIRRKC